MDKKTVAAVFSEIAVLLELEGANPFKVRAYQSGARALESLDGDLRELAESGQLGNIPGLGKALVEKAEILLETGRLPYHEELKASVPPGLIEMLEIPGLGPKKIKAIRDKLDITTLEGLTKACEDGRVAALPGFGQKSQQKIIEGIRNREAYGRRHLWWKARETAEPILEGLRGLSAVERAEHAGSLRRGLETVGDLDFIVASPEPGPVMEWFTSMDGILEVTARGETKSSVRLEGGLQADLRVVPPEQFVFALHHFTGSKDHNVKMRQRALSRGYSLSEWGLTRKEGGGKESAEPPVRVADEAELFRFLGLREIPPELREGMGEIEEAEERDLPDLVKPTDIRGVFHNHTNASDGHATLAEMARAAKEFGWEYLGIADHSKASFQANGLSAERLERQVAEIRRLNESGEAGIHLFSGLECDILPDGSLDFGDDVLGNLDYVVASVHSSFSQSEEDMTRRIIRAVEHPLVTMLGHLTGRLLLMREGYRVDAAKVIDAAAANNVIIEINAHPRRLDMDWRLWRRASQKGVLASINPDAHDTGGLAYYEAGVVTARKGWLTAEQVFNTRPLAKVKDWLDKRKAPA